MSSILYLQSPHIHVYHLLVFEGYDYTERIETMKSLCKKGCKLAFLVPQTLFSCLTTAHKSIHAWKFPLDIASFA